MLTVEAATLNPSLREKLSSIQFDKSYGTQLLPVLIIMKDQADFNSVYDQSSSLPKYDRKEITKTILKDIADKSQAELIEVLQDYEIVGKSERIDRLWDGSPTYPNHGRDFYNNENDPIDNNMYGGGSMVQKVALMK